MQSLDGTLFSGALHIEGTVAIPVRSAPRYALQATLTGANMAQAGAPWHETWGNGVLGGMAQFTAFGGSADALRNSVAGRFHLAWQHGSLGTALPRFTIWDANGTLGPDGLTMQHSDLSGTPETVEGTVGWDRSLHLTLKSAVAKPGQAKPGPVPITGTLDKPVAGQAGAAPQP